MKHVADEQDIPDHHQGGGSVWEDSVGLFLLSILQRSLPVIRLKWRIIFPVRQAQEHLVWYNRVHSGCLYWKMERGAKLNKVILRGRRVNGGSAEGEALVTRESLGGFGCFDFDTGKVIDFGHELYGKDVSGKILVFKTGKGSSAWSIAHQALRFVGKSPKAYITKESNPQTALGAVVARVPAVTDFDQDPTEVISTGDWVKVDADRGIVEITKK
jgi:predicted aconitase with swiveling domain